MTYIKPSLDLLKENPMGYPLTESDADKICKEIIRCAQAHKLELIHVDTRISPTNIIYAYKLGEVTRFRDIKSRQNDISLAVSHEVDITQNAESENLVSISLRKRTNQRSYVSLRSVLESKAYQESNSPLTIAAGISEDGNPLCINLKDGPHMMISGTTGVGKTVFLDDIILSFLYRSSPDDLKMVFIDPVGTDLATYQGIPHLIFPVISGKNDALEAIKYIRNRMNERFELFTKVTAKTIDSYNMKSDKRLPYIVVIIDKYLEMTYEIPAEFEECLGEVLRKGRAAGIHVIINTQTARAEVVDRSITTNIPYRVAFSVTDWHESKAILDRSGAQKLLGDGDMLVSLGNSDTTIHVQAANVSLSEVQNIVNTVKTNNEGVVYANDFSGKRFSNLSRSDENVNVPDKSIYPETDNEEPKPAGLIENDNNVQVDKAEDKDYMLYISLLESLSNLKKVSAIDIQKIMDIGYSDSYELIKVLEKDRVVSRFALGKGRTVNHERIEQLLNEYYEEGKE